MRKHITDVLFPFINARKKDFVLPDGELPRAIVFLGFC
jgi:hypothetical protein